MKPSLELIDPDRVYSFSEACKFIPSCKNGKRSHISKLHRWVARGKLLNAFRDVSGHWFAYGRDLIAAARAKTESAPAAGNDFVAWYAEAEAEKRYRDVRRQLDRMGVGVVDR